MLPSYREMFHLDEDRVASQIVQIVYALQELHAHVRPLATFLVICKFCYCTSLEHHVMKFGTSCSDCPNSDATAACRALPLPPALKSS